MTPPHAGDLPEGLHLDFDGVGITIRDAQDHPWVSIHEAAFGDPPIWREAILRLVTEALGVPQPDAMSEAELGEAVDKVKAICDEHYADGYRGISMRSGLMEAGYSREQIAEVLDFVANRGFEYCLDHTIECSSGTTGKPRSRPDEQVCWWGPDQLKSRLDCLSSRPYPRPQD